MNPECQSLLALFAHRLPQAHITLITSARLYLLNLYVADEKITHFIVINRVHLPPVPQLEDYIGTSDFIDLIELSPVALRLEIADEAGHFSFCSRAMALA